MGREAYQHDFAARMDWCVADSHEKANHNPMAVLAGDRSKAVGRQRVRPEQTVVLDASGSRDPDGDNISCRWFVCREADTCREEVPIERHATAEAGLIVPEVNLPATVRVILEVKDDGKPNLFSYRRLILEVEP